MLEQEFNNNEFSIAIQAHLADYEVTDQTQQAAFIDSLSLIHAASPYFIIEKIQQNPEILVSLLTGERLLNSIDPYFYVSTLQTLIPTGSSEEVLMSVLRKFRTQELIRIAWRDIAGWAALEETLTDLSRLAEACVRFSLDFLFKALCQKTTHIPVGLDGKPQQMLVLAMGKLGAGELNFSSDIDLIFVYEIDGILSDKKETSYSEFYTKLARSLIKVIDTLTADGFVYRVDTRLRPFGNSGPLVLSFDGMELYYQGHAREWERYAMIKARVIAGDAESGERLQAILTPFIYRRYLDYRALGELRGLKEKIHQGVVRNDKADNIKLGNGGIREIEFIGQVFQLIHGGREKRLRVRTIWLVLDLLAELEYLSASVVVQLKECYVFLRILENRLQQYGDQQTHDLPIDTQQRTALAYCLGFNDWDVLKLKIDEQRAIVHGIFKQILSPKEVTDDQTCVKDWLESDQAQLILALPFDDAEASKQISTLIARFSESVAISRLNEKSRCDLNHVLRFLVSGSAQLSQPVLIFERILKLLEAISRRTVYYALLAENPSVIQHLIQLADHSSWIVNYIAKNPILLDELIDPRELLSPLTKAQLKLALQQALAPIDTADVEELMIALRQFKQANILKIAAAEIAGVIPVMVVSDYLTWLAEVLLEETLLISWQITAERTGVPPNCSIDMISHFAIIAYGKLGGIELSYSSDLDLVFLYAGLKASEFTNGESAVSVSQFFARVVKKMITLITTQILSGPLYEIDLRLRPSGNSGLLVSSLEAYEAYQEQSAWTWEQQALVRARFVAGDPEVASEFLRVRSVSLGRQRDGEVLREEVKTMRDKMRDNLEVKTPGWFDLKQARGGIADIEFIVQFGVLLNAHDHPPVLQWTDVVRNLVALSGVGFLSLKDSERLKEAYCLYRERTHQLALLEQPALVPEQDFATLRDEVIAIWNAKMDA